MTSCKSICYTRHAAIHNFIFRSYYEYFKCRKFITWFWWSSDFSNVSFRLLKGSILGWSAQMERENQPLWISLTDRLMPEWGKDRVVEKCSCWLSWSAYSIRKGMTIRSVLSSAFDFLFEMETRMNLICDQLECLWRRNG